MYIDSWIYVYPSFSFQGSLLPHYLARAVMKCDGEGDSLV